ncbi:ArnT family glycosyltransferase [Acaryochloris marina]|uniref:ArnT family glycosyltransferase n=1 Tax=Acaryochloris marina TaxID=155978 RepID=UPI0021C34CD9|nr:glycosyltransferase family 39 protein [Acaryochloris marina]BDM82185.1 hypothetical protein AM10699_50490 [Acaryochloris marina MBIC10699]
MLGAVALIPITEIAAVILSIFIGLRTRPNAYPVAAALALGIVSGLGLLSFLLQIGFLLGRPEWLPFVELAVLLPLVGLQWRRWPIIRDIPQRIIVVGREAPVTVTVLAIALLYLLLQAVLLPPSSWDALTYHLPRVLLWEQNRSLFLRDFIITPQAAFPVGSDILSHLFLRFGTDYGLGLFSWLSYLTILLATYGLARPRVNRHIALTTALVIASLPEVVYQATATKNDIILAAVAIACVVWADRWLQSRSFESLLGLGLTLCFGVAVKTTFVLFAFFFGLTWLSLVIQQGRLSLLVQSSMRHWRWIGGSLVPAVILSQAWLFWDNYRQFGGFLGPAKFAIANRNNDGLVGGIANLIRYSFQSIHLLQPVDILWKKGMGWSLTDGLQHLYNTLFEPILGVAGRSQLALSTPFVILWDMKEDTSWFGPLGIFLVVPAMVWCAVKGQRLPRIMAFVSIALILALCYAMGWSPWKSRFFILVAAMSGLCVAMLLQRLQPRPWMLNGLRMLSLVILCYACAFNFAKPLLFMPSPKPLDNIWVLSDWTRNRLIYEQANGGDRVEQIGQNIPPGKKVAIVGYDHYFPMMFHNPGREFVLLPPDKTPDKQYDLATIESRLAESDYLLCLEQACDRNNLDLQLNLLWQNAPHFRFTQLYEITSPTRLKQR